MPAFAGFRAVGWTTELTVAILLFSLPAGPNVRHVSLHQVSFAAIGTVAFSKLSVRAGLPWLVAFAPRRACRDARRRPAGYFGHPARGAISRAGNAQLRPGSSECVLPIQPNVRLRLGRNLNAPPNVLAAHFSRCRFLLCGPCARGPHVIAGRRSCSQPASAIDSKFLGRSFKSDRAGNSVRARDPAGDEWLWHNDRFCVRSHCAFRAGLSLLLPGPTGPAKSTY